MRSDPLNPGTSYPAITITVNVAFTAASTVTNQVNVSGGGSASAGASDLTSILPPNPCDLQQTGIITVADVQLLINEALGLSAAVNDLTGNGMVNIVDVQIGVNALLGLGCTAN
jgi:hypothetical protein